MPTISCSVRRTSAVLTALVVSATAACSGGGVAPDSDQGPNCAVNPSACEPPPPPPPPPPATLTQAERESNYIDSLNVILAAGGDFAAALAWVRTQDEVIAANADSSALYFQLKDGEPVFMLNINDGTSAEGTPPVLALPNNRAAVAGTVSPQGIVVGAGTPRDNPQNHKRALFLEPFQWQFGGRFGEHVTELRQIPDYAHTDAVRHVGNSSVTPELFGTFDSYDAVFVSTHGAQFDGHTWISTGVVKEHATGKFSELCKEVKASYVGVPGVRCGVLDEGKRRFVAVGLMVDFFQQKYGAKGGLKRAVVYMGGCNTSRKGNWHLADALSGSNSAYFGWNGAVYRDKHPLAIDALLSSLIELRRTTQTSLDVACLADRCGGPDWGSTGAELNLFDNGDASKKLRLYDPLTLKDPRNPTATLGLAPGDTLLVEGVAGDGINDRVRLVVDVTGVIDPNDTGGPVGSALRVPTASPLAAQTANPADLYNVGFTIDGQPIGFDNLGTPSAAAEVSQLDATTWRYSYTADLPFDVDEGGQSATLKVEVPLPEGGFGDYEVDVVLTAPVCSFRFTLGDQVVNSQPGDRMTFATANGRLWNLVALRPSAGWGLTLLPPDTLPSTWPNAPGSWPMVMQGDMGLTDPDDVIFATDPDLLATFVLDTLVPLRRVQGTVRGSVDVVSTTNSRTLDAEWFFSIRYEPGQFQCIVGGNE